MILSVVFTVLSAYFVINVANTNYNEELWFVVVFALIFAFSGGLICALFHEFGHVFFAKKKNFAVLSVKVWFFKWVKNGKKYDFSTCRFGEESGATEVLPIDRTNLSSRYRSVAFGGILASFINMVLGIVPLFLTPFLPFLIYLFLAMFLPIGAYYFFGNFIPSYQDGILNDGGVIYEIGKDTDNIRVLLNILSIHSEMYNGKTPKEIDKGLYFDLPQLQEDNLNFINLLTLRYDYYLDSGDNENAIKTANRLNGLQDYIPKFMRNYVDSICLYNACTIDFNEKKADDLTEDIEKFLNSDTSLTVLRVKMAYILYVRREKSLANDFYNKAIKMVARCQILGQGLFEKGLLDKMKKDI